MRSWVVACLALGYLTSGVAPARAFCRLTTESPVGSDACVTTGFPLEWRWQCIEYALTDTVSEAGPPLSEVREIADMAFAAWTQVSCSSGPLPLSVRQSEQLGACLQPEYNIRGRNANTVIFVDDWRARELPPAALGLTELWHDPDSGEIYDADMRINQSRGVPAICDETCPSGSIDLLNVLTHEAGHFFGLGHSTVPGATMGSRAIDGETEKRSLEQDDRDGICSIYDGLGAPSCEDSDYAPDNGFAAACGVPALRSGDDGMLCAASGLPPLGRAPGAALSLLAPLVLVARRRARRHTES